MFVFKTFSIFNAKKVASVVLLSLLAAGVLPGCGEPERSNVPLNEPVQKFEKVTTLSGTVSDEKGDVTSGKIVATDEKGKTIVDTVLPEGSSRYSIEIPAGTPLPILLKAYPESGASKGKPMVVAIVEPSLSRYDINPRSTAIARKAESLGGYTRKNLVAAAMMSGSVPDEEHTTSGFKGDPTKRYGGWH